MDYLASCNGDCTTVDKTALLFNKIDEAGLINGSPAPGTWASDTLIANNNSWTVTIPSTIAPGKYVLRHETIALHSAENLDGSQAYPQCVNLEITGSGTNTLSTGTIAQDFYKDTDPGILVNIYYPALTNYTIPGPALIADAVSASQSSILPSATANAKPSAGTASASASSSSNTKIAASPSSAPYKNSTMTTASPTTTSTVFTHPSAVHSPSSPSVSASALASSSSSKPASTSPPHPTLPAPTSTSSSGSTAAPVFTYTHPVPTSSSSVAVAAEPTATSTSTSPVSFTSTFTGRIGKPTKFTCYIDED